MDFDGKQAQQLLEALLSALPTRYSLEKTLLFGLDVELDRISRARSLEERVFYVIKWARHNGRLGDLLAAVRSGAPDDEKLAALADAIVSQPESPPAERDAMASTTERRPVVRPSGAGWHLWANGSTLRVRFLDGDKAICARILKHAQEWTKYANLRFKVAADGDADVRVTLKLKNEGSWAYSGTMAKDIARTEPTVNFGWFDVHTGDDDIRRTVLHEFGHVLGLIHEFQNPKATISWDWPKVYSYFAQTSGWTKAETDAAMKPLSPKMMPGYRSFDPNSIMMFAFPDTLTTNRVAFTQPGTLSESDKLFAATLYPRDGTRLGTAKVREAPPPKKSDLPARLKVTTRQEPRPAAGPGSNMLFLSAQPFNTRPLELDKEFQLIQESLLKSEGGRSITPFYLPRVRFADIDQHLLFREPTIVHFSGHGDSAGRLMFSDGSGAAKPASVEMVANLFDILRDRIRCVVLNACYSKPQAAAICANIDCVVGMSRAIKDEDAIAFAEKFYMTIGLGRSVRTAFDLACQTVGMRGRIDDASSRSVSGLADPPLASTEKLPVLMFRKGVDPERVVLAPAASK